MDVSLTSVAILLFVIYLIYFILNSVIFKSWNYFTDRGIKFDRGMPILGSLGPAMIGRESIATTLQNLYKRFPTDKFFGFYQMGGKPSYMVCDPELIKKITIKDFDHFVNHGFQINRDLDPLMGRILFNVNDEKWRELRAILSPLFTGSKMRSMLTLMGDTIDDFTNGIKAEVTAAGSNGLEYNLMDLFTCSTNDAIASCAFGIRMNSFKNRDNDFYTTGKKLAYAAQSPKVFFVMALPTLTKWLKVKIVTDEQNQFFRDIVMESVAHRTKNNIVRNDMIHLLLLMRDGKLESIAEKDDLQDAGFATVSELITSKTTEKLRNWTDDDLVSQCLLFFLAGFTGIATTLCFLAHEMAACPDIQEKLYEEISQEAEHLNGEKITYEKLQKMKYLDMVITEVMRKWGINVMIDRMVTKQYVMENTDGSKVLLQPGEQIWIPAFAIQRDEKYYPNPEVFDPERFSAENRGDVNLGAYLPFGIGPRACIASRFALMQLKASVYYLLLNFRLECSAKTQIPIKLKKAAGSLEPENGFWLQFKLRN